MSLATLKRDLDVIRDTMQAPIEWHPSEAGSYRGYVLKDKNWASGKLGLPATWFTASEIYAIKLKY